MPWPERQRRLWLGKLSEGGDRSTELLPGPDHRWHCSWRPTGLILHDPEQDNMYQFRATALRYVCMIWRRCSKVATINIKKSGRADQLSSALRLAKQIGNRPA